MCKGKTARGASRDLEAVSATVRGASGDKNPLLARIGKFGDVDIELPFNHRN